MGGTSETQPTGTDIKHTVKTEVSLNGKISSDWREFSYYDPYSACTINMREK
jgi:hypothetical protein